MGKITVLSNLLFILSIVVLLPFVEPSYTISPLNSEPETIKMNLHHPELSFRTTNIVSAIYLNISYVNVYNNDTERLLTNYEFIGDYTFDVPQNGFYTITLLVFELGDIEIKGEGLGQMNLYFFVFAATVRAIVWVRETLF